MSIRAMTWAFSLPLEPRAKIALLAIADNARDDGVAWPSRDLIAEKSTQSRATINRRLKILAELGVLRLVERYREDGSQTTDEIRLDLSLSPVEVMRRMQGLSAADLGEEADETVSDDGGGDGPEGGEGGYQPDTPPMQSGHPGDAVVTPPGLQSGNPLMNRHLNQESPPNPPPGGVRAGDGPLRKADKAAIEKREALWQRFLGSYPGVAAMDQQAAKEEFDQLAVDDAEWAVSVAPGYGTECGKLRKPPKNAHIWLRKGMFKNFPRGKIEPPPPDGVWIVEGSEADRALRFARELARVPHKFVRTGPDGSRGYTHPTEVGADLIAMLAFVNDVHLRWPAYPRGSENFGSWQARFQAWIGHRLPTEPGSDCIRVPDPWPPNKNGERYPAGQRPEINEENPHG